MNIVVNPDNWDEIEFFVSFLLCLCLYIGGKYF